MRPEKKVMRINKGYDYSMSDSRILRFGRYEESEDGLFSNWSGFAFRFTFAGTGCEIGIRANGIYFDVIVDGVRSLIKAHAGKEKYQLASRLQNGTHEVIVARRSQSLRGGSAFLGLSACKNQDFELIPPADTPRLHVEIIGDSIAAGCLSETDDGENMNAENENGYMAFGPVVARLLSAGWSNISVRGCGLCRNRNEEKPYKGPHMGDYYDGAVYPQTGGYTRNHKKAGIIIIELGTADFEHNDPPSALMYAAVYSKLIRKALRRNKGARVICMAPFLNGEHFETCRHAIAAAAGSLSHRNVFFADPVAGKWFDEVTYKECFPDNIHPNAKGHAVIAEKLVALIGERSLQQTV